MTIFRGDGSSGSATTLNNTSGYQIISVNDDTFAALRITQTGTGNALVVEDSTNPDSTPFVVNSSGDVGIGTNTPDAKLTVAGVASFADGSAAAPSITNIGDLNTGIYFPTADTIAFVEGGVEVMRINSSGNVGIGTTSPTSRLDVRGDIIINSTSNLSSVTLGAFDDDYSGFTAVGNTTGFTIAYGDELLACNNATSNIGIGTTSPSTSALLDLRSTTKGVRMPNMTTAQKNAIASPVAGLTVYDTTLSSICVYNGAGWTKQEIISAPDFGGTDTITLSVPSQYATIQLALNYLANKRIAAGTTVKIQVADGTYNLTAGLNLNHPDGSQIQLLGNVTTPANVVLSVAGSGFDCLTVSDGNVLGLVNGFKFFKTVKALAADNTTAILANKGARIFCGTAIVVDNWYYGIAAREHSHITCHSATVTNSGDVGIWAFCGSQIFCDNAVSNTAEDVANNLGFGFQAEYGSVINGNAISATGCRIGGIASLSNSNVRALSGATASSNTGSGFFARDGATIECHGATASNNTRYGVEEIADGHVYYSSITAADNTLGNFSPNVSFDNGALGARIVADDGSLRIDNSGTGSTFFNTSGGLQFSIAHTASAVNRFQVTGSATGVAVSLATVGTDTNISLRLSPKGTGSVGIGTSTPDASALLDVQSTTKGVRMPNMTTTQKNAIASPVAGLMVFDTTLSKMCVYTGSAWAIDADGTQLSSSTGSSLVGHIGTGTGSVARTVQSKLRDSINVKDFGVVGNGSTDDTTAIQAAIDYAGSVGAGQDVYFPRGVYRITASLNLTSNNVRLVGHGLLSVRIYRDFTTGATVNIASASDARNTGNGVIGITFNHNTALTLASSNVAHIKAVNCDTLFIEDIRMFNTIEGIELQGGNSLWLNNLNITGDYNLYASRYGIKLSKSATGGGTAPIPTSLTINNAWVTGQTVNGAFQGGFGYALWITAGENASITNSYFAQGYFYSVLIEQQSNNANILDTRFNCCYIDAGDRDSTYGDGVYIVGSGIQAGETWDSTARSGGDGSIQINNVHFTNCTLKGQGGDGRDGLSISPIARAGAFAQALSGLKVTGCTISAWYRHGIYLGGSLGAVITGNTIEGNNYTNAGSGSGVVIDYNSVDAVVVGNRIGGNAFGLSGATAYQLYGVDIRTSVSKYLVAENNVIGNATAGILQSSIDGILFNNYTGTNSDVSNENGLTYLARSGASSTPTMLLRPATTPANYLEMIGSNAGSAIRMVSSGSDTNININVEPKGTAVLNVTKPIRVASYTVATLPSASPSYQKAFVTDALSPIFGSIVVGAGAVVTPVYSDGTNWRVG